MDNCTDCAKREQQRDKNREKVIKRWKERHKSNPGIYNAIKGRALWAYKHGMNHYGINAIWEDLRYTDSVQVEGKPKLPNGHQTIYARLLVHEHPELSDMIGSKPSMFDGITPWSDL